MDGGRWIGFDGVVRAGSGRLHSNGDAQDDPLCIWTWSGSTTFSVDADVSADPSRRARRSALAAAFSLWLLSSVSARDERDNFLSERVRVAPGDWRRGPLRALAELAEEAAAADRVLVRLRRDELRDRVRLDVAAAVQRSQFFEQVVFVLPAREMPTAG